MAACLIWRPVEVDASYGRAQAQRTVALRPRHRKPSASWTRVGRGGAAYNDDYSSNSFNVDGGSPFDMNAETPTAFGVDEGSEFFGGYDEFGNVFGSYELADSADFQRSTAEEALNNPMVQKLLLLANYTTVGIVFFFLFFRTMHHYEAAALIETPIQEFLCRTVLVCLMAGDAASSTAALLRRRGLKAMMKSMLTANCAWECLDGINNFRHAVFGSSPLPREELLAGLLWNVFFTSLCLSVQRVSWS